MPDITNIIIDGSFENGLTEQWKIGSLVEVEESDANHYCRIDSANTLTQTVTLETFMTYLLTVSVKGNMPGKLSVKSTDNAIIFLDKEINTASDVDWHTESLEFSTQDIGGTVNVCFSAPGEIGTGSLFVDDIAMVAVPFVFTRPLWVNMDKASQNYTYYQYGLMTTKDAAVQTYRLYKNDASITEFTIGPDDFIQNATMQTVESTDVFKLTIYNAKTTAEHPICEETMDTLMAKGVIYLTE